MTKNTQDIPAAVRAIMAEASRQAEAAAGGALSATMEPSASPFPSEDLSPEDTLAEAALEPETDIGNGRRFLIRYGRQVVHVARVGWHGYDKRRWKEDEDGSVVRPLAQRTAEMIADEARLLTATEEEEKAINAGRDARAERKKMGTPKKDWDAEKLARWIELEDLIDAGEQAKKKVDGRKSSRHRHAKSSAGTSKLNNMMTEAAPHVAKMVGDLNCDLYAVNCNNGTLRFFRRENEESDPDHPTYHPWEVRLDPHNPADFISKLAPFDWSPSAAAQEFDSFLKRVQPDREIREFLQRFCGYCLLGLTIEQCLVFFYGAGRNGKSTFVDLLCQILGDYAVTLSIDSFAGDTKRGGSEATPDLARLPGARFVSASEPEMGVKLKDALIKTLTGGEKIPVRRLHQDFIEVMPQFKIILSGNHKPRIDDTSDGIWRRVNLVPWEVQIPKQEVDRDLPQKLKAEATGVLNWMVQGAINYLNSGLATPEKVLAATNEYREESDPIGAFIRAACIVSGNEEDVSTPADLFIGYSNFAGREGAPEFKQGTFARRFPDYTRMAWRGDDDTMRRFWKAKSGTTVYKGIRVRDEFVRPAPQSHGEGYDQ
nr:phage/plasmid primase, P4 family [Brucella intermedia]